MSINADVVVASISKLTINDESSSAGNRGELANIIKAISIPMPMSAYLLYYCYPMLACSSLPTCASYNI